MNTNNLYINEEQFFERAKEERILDDYGEGYLMLIKAPETVDIKSLQGEALKDLSENIWDIWEG